MIVRQLQSHELDSTVVLFNYYKEEAIEAFPSRAHEYDENSIIETIRNLSIHHTSIWLNLYEGQRPVGFIAGALAPIPWNKNLSSAHIYFLFVLPSHRSMESVQMLVDEFESWAKNCKCCQITGGDIGINLERTKKIYNHLGFRESVLMIKELPE